MHTLALPSIGKVKESRGCSGLFIIRDTTGYRDPQVIAMFISLVVLYSLSSPCVIG